MAAILHIIAHISLIIGSMNSRDFMNGLLNSGKCAGELEGERGA
jgi:hypothetical protein